MSDLSQSTNDSCRLRFYRDPILRVTCSPVHEFDDSMEGLVLKMATTMHGYEGIGLAAPQVGIPLRMFVADVGDGLLVVANPEIQEREGSERMVEGCLSLPEIHVEIERSRQIFLSGLTASGEERTWECSDLMARVVQHEIDHLDGVLITDHATFTERLILRRQMKRLEKLQKRTGGLAHSDLRTPSNHQAL